MLIIPTRFSNLRAFKGTCSRVTTFLTDSDELVSGFDTFAENKSSGGNMENLENFEN